MPTFRTCIWNIQNLGSDGDPAATRRGVNGVLLGQFAGVFLREAGIDVLIIQEVSPNAAPTLAAMQTEINNAFPAGQRDWWFDWVGCSIASDAAHDPPTVTADISFAGGPSAPRYEGYAVFWRGNQGARFTLRQAATAVSQGAMDAAGAAAGTHFVELVTVGRPYGDNNGYWNPLGGYTVANLVPYRNGVLEPNWPRLDFLSVSNLDPFRPIRNRSRRPAYVVVDLVKAGRPTGERALPIIAFHAPSNAALAGMSSQISSMTRELYVTPDYNNLPALVHNENVVFGGDFNVAQPFGGWPGDFLYATQAFGQGWNTGAACVSAVNQGVDVERLTSVRLQRSDGTIINSANPNDYLKHPLDQMMYRGAAAGGISGQYQFVNILLNNAAYTNVMQAWEAHFVAVCAGYAPATLLRRIDANAGPQSRKRNRGGGYTAWSNLYTGAYGAPFTDWNAFRARTAVGTLNTARMCAEFYVMFISDHLPVVYEFNY